MATDQVWRILPARFRWLARLSTPGGSLLHAWWLFAATGLIAAVGYILLPGYGRGHLVLWLAIGLGAATAVAVAAWRSQLRPALPWALLAASLGLSAVGDAITGGPAGRAPWPAAASGLLALVLAVVALALLARARLPATDPAGLLDALVIGTGLIMVCLGALARSLEVTQLSAGGQVQALARPLLGGVGLTVLSWLWLEQGQRAAPLRLLGVAVLGLLVSDLLWARAVLLDNYKPGGPIDLGWAVWALGCGAAALHPAAFRLALPALGPARRLTAPRIGLMAGASLIAPLVLVVLWAGGRENAVPMIAGGWALLFLLTMVRLIALARQVAAQAERRRALGQVIQATEDERTRISRDLHDGPVQQLAVLTYAVHGIKRRLGRGDMIGANRMLEGLEDGLTKEVQSLRRLMTELRPPVLDERGLEVALRDQVTAFARQSGLRASFESRLPGRLPQDLETVLYRVAQEALHNVAKHAKAESVTVGLYGDDEIVVLTVRDDGIGFDVTRPSELLRHGHYGLAGMRERAAIAGGRFEVRSTRGEGSVVEVTLPRDMD
jgi:signal transduction histidine kinase